MDDLQKVVMVVDKSKAEVKESKAARRLFKKVNSMIGKMDAVLEQEKNKLMQDLEDKSSLEEKETQQKRLDKFLSIKNIDTLCNIRAVILFIHMSQAVFT